MYVYSNLGKTWHDPSRRFGMDIHCSHKSAISIAVGLNPRMIAMGPVPPMSFEILRAYAQLANIAVSTAKYIRALGYPARAHILTNYQVLCVPVAIDAGMGELGRHGLMLTKELGSALKLATITTDFPLIYDRPRDTGLEEFCKDWKICAECCPGGAIGQGAPKAVNGVERWVINPKACFTIWNETGTDCGVCIASCPWTNPRTRFHRLMVEIASRKHKAGWWMSRADKLFCGRYKPSRPSPWFEEESNPVWKRYRRRLL